MKVDTPDPVVAFTFDDGPDPDCTPAILDVLRHERARATFFVLGDAARRNPALVQRAVAEGHEIGLHGLSHRALPDLSLGERASSIMRGRREVVRAGARHTRWFRAPYGKQTVDAVLIARALGMRAVMWSAYAREWEEHATDWCVEHAASAMEGGSIVLLHDGAAGERGRSRPTEQIVEILTSLLGRARDRGLEVVPVGELVRRGRSHRRMWFREWRV